MKQFFLSVMGRWLLGLGVGLGLPALAAAQCTLTPFPAGCPTPFVAIDVATGQEVQALCVGRAVRFDLSCGRSIASNLLYYNALAGTNTTPTNCDFTPGKLTNNTFTPTAAGAFTISELANPASGSGVGTVFVRNFQVYASPAPTISLAPCLNNSVALTIAASGYDQYFAQVNGGALIGPLAVGTATIPAPAGSSLTVVGRYLANGLCEGRATQTVPPIAAPQTPVLNRLTVQTVLPTLTLGVEAAGLPAGYRYDVQRADASSPGGFRRVFAFAGASTAAFTLANTSAGLYRIGRRDVCGTDSAFSAPVPTILLSRASVNNVNNLTWQTAGPVASYTLLRNGTALATLPPGSSAYADAAVTCGTTYTYRLQATTAAGNQSVSNEVAVPTVSALPPAAPLLNASFDRQNRVVLTATAAGGAALPAGSQLYYSRQGGPGALDFGVVPAATDTLRDPAALATLLAAPPCYTLRLQDVCGNTSRPTPPTCPSLLAVAAADSDGLTAQLTWSAFQGPGSPAVAATYRVLSLGADGTVLATSAPTTSLSYFDPTPPPDRQVLRYRLEVSGAGLPAGTVSYSTTATLVRRPRLVVPNAFTPNGDGLNDVLELKGRYLNGFTFVVIDRNEQEVFRATDRTQTWDGTIRGHAPVNAAYVWRLTMQDETGQPFIQTGTVTVLK
ncbi:T9SS type B sorting domain-containing protein [Hymenobacter sp. HMF4947]|uniref:T9SS type B sorting domain-containing protein n=1 Tax=Hymenobacter ginkgonis TaxID=2682976 RepID=A0A7K1T9Z3_9BACT|nr:gliding motility-associated C-terminal domain-containing protein [Hymenobacter ginkgonis]MVN74991.1 T9SS type B sorting domain-containing protein [Hymenobacter ginkgonis]